MNVRDVMKSVSFTTFGLWWQKTKSKLENSCSVKNTRAAGVYRYSLR